MTIVDPITTSSRDMSDAISPTWLNAFVGSRWRYCQSILWDGLELMGAYAVYSALPSTAPPDALQWIGADRQVIRGPNETQTHFVQRLIQWLELARYAGTDTGILLSVLGYMSPIAPEIEVVDNAGVWWSYSLNQAPFPPTQPLPTTPTQVVSSPNNWNWDGLTDNWWRSWLVIFATSIPWASPGSLFGDAGVFIGDNTAIGFSQPAPLFKGITTSLSTKAAHTWLVWSIVSFDGTLFDPAQPADGVHNPDGSFGRWSKIIFAGLGPAFQYVQSRFANARYVDGAA